MGYEVFTYKCGHEAREQFYGKMVDRERKVAWKETQLCPECERAAGIEYAKPIEQKYNLVGINGSEKQVAWARKIRATIIDGFTDIKFREGGEAMVINAINEIKSASWWIDHRDYDGIAAVSIIGREIAKGKK